MVQEQAIASESAAANVCPLRPPVFPSTSSKKKQILEMWKENTQVEVDEYELNSIFAGDHTQKHIAKVKLNGRMCHFEVDSDVATTV